MSGHVVGSREIRIVSEKIEITSLSVQVISGLSLNIYPDPDLESCYVAEVDISEKLISKYQVFVSVQHRQQLGNTSIIRRHSKCVIKLIDYQWIVPERNTVIPETEIQNICSKPMN